ncbi:MAG: sugar transferase [Thermogemmatispora sp.]|uniref:sugar transferase n=1 Tax=Thermogemmatispora sp. TaxID=1968838 RepID=UPI0026303600|nr:sugar transferase [Thermogemmatispora sp.]MBX5457559.1 sugar transferase [Thermogemmatispora sp.]
MAVLSEPCLQIPVDPGYLRLKRLVDVTVTLALLPLLLVVMGVIAVLIRLDSSGPVFFRQKRLGLNGKEFTLLKFRSMYANSDDYLHREAIRRYMNGDRLSSSRQAANPYKLNDDPRITRIGRLLRRTSLDELPQFFNVLHGEMSLVGPRPPLPYEVEQYSERDRLRLAGKPGLTGYWQVYGRSKVDFKTMVEMDIAYLQRQSIWEDLRLIALTPLVMLSGRGGA